MGSIHGGARPAILIAALFLLALMLQAHSQSISIDGSTTSPQVYASDTQVNYIVTGNNGDQVMIVYCPSASYSSANCYTSTTCTSSCTGTIAAGQFFASDCLDYTIFSGTESTGTTLYVGFLDNDNPESQWIEVQISGGGTACGGGGGGGGGNTFAPTSVTNTICSIYYDINTTLYVLALAIMLLGGAIYGGANLLPGQTRGAVQAYGMGLIMGGTVGAIIGIAAPWLVGSITTQNVANVLTSTCPQFIWT